MKCKCDFRTFMVGDGCDVCNPAKALEYARETIDEQATLIEEMGEALRYYREEFTGSEPSVSVLDRKADEAIAKWKESK